MELLKLKKSEYYKTKTILTDNKLIDIDSNENIHISNDVSFIGRVSKDKDKQDYTRIFKETIKELYNQSTTREHKKLALFIELLPYIHFKYNIICNNPSCKLIEDVEPLTPKDISNVLQEYNNKNSHLIKKQLLSIHIGNKESILYVERFNKKFFAVNPLIYYKGKRIEDLSFLIELFKI
jgi:hypothetical protein